ncbi:hypothetical protein MTR67_013535, partial [Solanum verrucosum]
TFLNRTTQLPKGITHSYELGIPQTRRCWKYYSKSFPTISRSTRNSPGARSYGHLKLTKIQLFLT